jgi:hypothetical protein
MDKMMNMEIMEMKMDSMIHLEMILRKILEIKIFWKVHLYYTLKKNSKF